MSIRSARPLALALLLAVSVTAGATSARAYTYLESAYGTPLTGLSSRGLGMGGAVTALSDGSFSLVQNPAMLAGEDRRVADLTIRAVRYDETRFVPLFDTFDSFVKETAVAENPKTYFGLNGGLVWRPAGEGGKWAVAGGVFERYNHQFDFVDERRNGDGRNADSRDKVYATQFITSSRAVYSASAGIGYREQVLSMGATLHYYFGDLSFSNRTVPGPVSPPSGAPTRTPNLALDRDMSAVGATFGVAAEVSSRLTLAASYQLPVKFDVDWRRVTDTETTIGNDNVDYPGRLAVGGAYRPRNTLGTTFTVDVARTFWEDLEDPILAATPVVTLPALRNTYEFRFGLEHIFYNNLPARFGFFYREAYAADEVDDAGLSFGTGWTHANFELGFSADVSKRSSRQLSITPRSSQDQREDRVQDSLLRGVIDVRYHF